MQQIRAMVGIWLIVVCGSALSQSKPEIVDSPPVVTDATVDAPCPIPAKNWPPAFTREMFEKNATGTVVLGVTTDACGRVVSVTVQKSSGHKTLDNAAISAVREWTLSAAQRANTVGGMTSVPVDFKINTLSHAPAPPAAPDWPKTHRHPRYVLVERSRDYANAAAAGAAIDTPDALWRTLPYPIAFSSFVQLEAPEGREFWYFIYNGSKPEVAVRYQPVFDNDEPIVRLTVICDKLPKQCEAIRALMMKGPDYARAKR